MVDIANWISNILKMEHSIPSNNFQLILTLSKQSILISNNTWFWTFQNEIQVKISTFGVNSSYLIFICSLLVYVPYFLKFSWSFSKLIFCLFLLTIRIPTLRKASFIEFFTLVLYIGVYVHLVLLFTRIVQFQLIPIGGCWHHLQVIYPIEQAKPVI